jgi:hypothetical protein
MLLLQAPNRIQEVRIGTSNSGSANQRFESSLPSQSRVVFVVSGGASGRWAGSPVFRWGEGRSFSLVARQSWSSSPSSSARWGARRQLPASPWLRRGGIVVAPAVDALDAGDDETDSREELVAVIVFGQLGRGTL